MPEINRKEFIASMSALGAAVATVKQNHLQSLLNFFVGKSDFPKQHVCSLATLEKGNPVYFEYLRQDMGKHILVKTNSSINGGVGPKKNIVAFCSNTPEGISGTEHAYTLPQLKVIVENGEVYVHGFNQYSISSQNAQEILGLI